MGITRSITKGDYYMKTTSICGSRRQGNTDLILKECDHQLSMANIPDYKNKTYNVAKLHIQPCRSCLKCIKNGKCVVKDDFQRVSKRMLESDLIIVGSPVYFSDVSSSVKALFDRTISLWHTKMLKGKKVILVATCAESGTGHTIDTMRHWVLDHEMQIVGTIEGQSPERRAVLKNEMTMKAIEDTARSCIGIGTEKDPKKSKK